jgi:hypothetical protein
MDAFDAARAAPWQWLATRGCYDPLLHSYPVIPGRRESAEPGIQIQYQNQLLDSGFTHFVRAPE